MSSAVGESTETNIVDLNHIIQLVSTLYNSQNPTEQNEANRRLIDLQSSNEAWHICWPLLDPSQSHPVEIHFFAANLLVLKINQSWAQQDEEWLEKQLRPKLFETLVKYASAPNAAKPVVDRLSLALANFALHSIPTFWPNAIENTLETFTSTTLPVNIPHQRVCDILLKILIFIPEEYSVMLPQPDQRAKLNSQITKSGPIVFKFLHTLLTADKDATSPECRQGLLKCLTSWTLHSQTSLLELDDGKTMLNLLYNLVMDKELCAMACSTLAATFSSQKADSYKNTVIGFIPKLAKLKEVIQGYIADDEMECAIKIYSLVINFSENHSRLFLRTVLNDGIYLEEEKLEVTKQGIFEIIRIILDCTAAPGIFGLDEKYSEMAFSFWFTFFENFYYYPEAYNDLICDTFNPLVDSLLQTFIEKAQYPPMSTYHQVWNDDQRESYRCYRQDLGDNISLIIHFPRARLRLLGQLRELLIQELTQLLQINQTGIPSDNDKPWQKLESVIFFLKSAAESVPFDENEHMPKIFEMIAKIPFNESQAELYCTVAEMISAYSDWLYTHSDHLATAFTILFPGVTAPNSHVRLMSTLSLKDLTSECQAVLQPYAIKVVSACTDAILNHSDHLNTNEKSRLMYTIGTTLAIAPIDTVASALNTLSAPLIGDLTLKAQSDPNTDPTSRSIILDRLTMLNNLVESLYVKQYSESEYEEGDENDLRHYEQSRHSSMQSTQNIQPAIGLLQQLVPIMTLISGNYRSDEEIMGRMSNTLKRAAKSLSLELKPVLADLLTIIVNAYEPLANSNILEGCVPLYMVFKVDKSLRQLLKEAFARISDKTLQVCMENSLRQLSLTVENYFHFATCICKKMPDFLTEQPSPVNIEYIYKLALASLELPEKRTLSEVCSFLSLFRLKSIGVDHLHKVFVSHLDLLLRNVFCIFGGNFSTPRNAIDNVTDLLYLMTDAQEAKECLDKIVAQENFPTVHVNCDQKNRFISKIIHEKNRRKYKDACSEFVLVVRNLNRVV